MFFPKKSKYREVLKNGRMYRVVLSCRLVFSIVFFMPLEVNIFKELSLMSKCFLFSVSPIFQLSQTGRDTIS